MPFVILFDGSAGSSWFADSLDRHGKIFIAGYEPLEWVGNKSYEGDAATAWQPAWLRTVWVDAPSTTASTWQQWLAAYHANGKLDPAIHRAPLTVRLPAHSEVASAAAIGFKVRPQTVEANALAATLAEALAKLNGKVLVINRRDKLAQAVSLYRRRYEGKAGQFLAQQPAKAASGAAARLQAELREGDPNGTAASSPALAAAASGPEGAGGNPWAAGGSGGGGGAAGKSAISPSDVGKMLDHREAQRQAIECLVRRLDRPTLSVSHRGQTHTRAAHSPPQCTYRAWR